MTKPLSKSIKDQRHHQMVVTERHSERMKLGIKESAPGDYRVHGTADDVARLDAMHRAQDRAWERQANRSSYD